MTLRERLEAIRDRNAPQRNATPRARWGAPWAGLRKSDYADAVAALEILNNAPRVGTHPDDRDYRFVPDPESST